MAGTSWCDYFGPVVTAQPSVPPREWVTPSFDGRLLTNVVGGNPYYAPTEPEVLSDDNTVTSTTDTTPTSQVPAINITLPQLDSLPTVTLPTMDETVTPVAAGGSGGLIGNGMLQAPTVFGQTSGATNQGDNGSNSNLAIGRTTPKDITNLNHRSKSKKASPTDHYHVLNLDVGSGLYWIDNNNDGTLMLLGLQLRNKGALEVNQDLGNTGVGGLEVLTMANRGVAVDYSGGDGLYVDLDKLVNNTTIMNDNNKIAVRVAAGEGISTSSGGLLLNVASPLMSSGGQVWLNYDQFYFTPGLHGLITQGLGTVAAPYTVVVSTPGNGQVALSFVGGLLQSD